MKVLQGFDHRPLIIYTCWNDRRGCKQFRFENKWILEDGCKQVVSRAWRERKVIQLDNFQLKLVLRNEELKNWSNKTFPNSQKRIEELQKLLDATYSGELQTVNKSREDIKDEINEL